MPCWEAVAASGMPLPSLRVLQAAGAIQAQKTPKEHGGFKRMWREEDVLIASIGAAISEHFAWNIRIVAENGETLDDPGESTGLMAIVDDDDILLDDDADDLGDYVVEDDPVHTYLKEIGQVPLLTESWRLTM